MSCGCGGSCQDRINSLEDGIRLLEQRLFYLEAKITSTQPVRDPYTYPTTVPRNTKIR